MTFKSSSGRSSLSPSLGLLTIGIVGILIFLFFGLLPLQKKIDLLRQSIEEAEAISRMEDRIAPVLAMLEENRKALLEHHQSIRPQSFNPAELQSIEEVFAQDYLGDELRIRSMDWELSPTVEDRAYWEIELTGPYAAFGPFFNRIHNWPAWNSVRSFRLRSEGAERRLEIVLEVVIQ